MCPALKRLNLTAKHLTSARKYATAAKMTTDTTKYKFNHTMLRYVETTVPLVPLSMLIPMQGQGPKG